MLPVWTLVIAIHAVAASLAMVLGAFQLLRRIRGDLLHRIVGWIWISLMMIVAAGSFLFGDWTQPISIFLRVLAVWVLVSVTLGIVMARRGNIARHRSFMTGNYVGLLAAFVGVVVVPSRRVPSWFVAHPLMMSLVAVAIVAVAGFVLAGASGLSHRLAPRSAKPRQSTT